MSESQPTSIRYTRTMRERDGKAPDVSLADNQWLRVFLLTFYYLLIIAGLIALYGRGDFSTPSFIYQGF